MELRNLKLGDSVTLLFESSIKEDEPCVKIVLNKKFSKPTGDTEYMAIGGPRYTIDTGRLKDLTKNRYIYPNQYESYKKGGYGCSLRFTMKNITTDDVGTYVSKPEAKAGLSPNENLEITLRIPHVPIHSTKLKEVTTNGSEVTEKIIEKESEKEILIVKSDILKTLQYEIELKTKTKPTVTFDGGEHTEGSPVNWNPQGRNCQKSSVNILYQHEICTHTYSAKFKDFRLKDNGKSIRIKATAQGYVEEPEIIVYKLKIVSKPEFECDGYTGVEKTQVGPFNISCNIYMNPISDDWRLVVNGEYELYSLNDTMTVDNNTLTTTSSKNDEEYKLQVILSTKKFDMNFLNDLNLKIKAENEHGSNEKDIKIQWAGKSHIMLSISCTFIAV